MSNVQHPVHYGGDTTYEAIKVIEAWDLGFHLGNAAKYISRAGKKGDRLEDLQKARWYIDREIARLAAASPAEAPSRPVQQQVLRSGARVRVRQGYVPTMFITARLGREGTVDRANPSMDGEWYVRLDGDTAPLIFYTGELEVIG